MISFIIFLLIIIILTYYYYNYLQHHFWYNLGKNLGKPKFYTTHFHPNVYSKKDLTEEDKIGLVQLYKNYLQGVTIDKKNIEYFLSTMQHSQIFYMKNKSIYYGAVMNSIIEIEYKNKLYLSNFVDNAIINIHHRDKGIFKELMNYISKYSNEMNAKYVIFKIDRKPIPSFYDYNITSNYYYMMLPFKKCGNSKIVHLFSNEKKEICNYWNKNNNYFGVNPSSKEFVRSIIINDKFRITLQSNKTIMNFKRNSVESIELLYIYNPEKQDIMNIIEYLQNNYSFKIILTDDIGNNHHLIKAYPESFKIAYPVYHYILGFKEKISKEDFFYYF